MNKLQGRVAVITGGGRGIGAAIAQAFAAEGARLVVASRSADELDRVAHECRALGTDCLTCVTDVSKNDDVGKLVQTSLARFGRIDILATVAGVYGPIGPIGSLDLDEWQRALQVNLMGTLFACQAVVPTMIAQGRGKIITMSGGGATAALPLFSAYAASKAAVVRLTETLAMEVKSHGISVNAIAPGAVDTNLQDAVLQAGELAGELYQRINALRNAGTGGTPIDVPARLALFLASDDSDGLTGRLISAPHDGWQDWAPATIEALGNTPWFTLRRLDPFTVEPLMRGLPG